MNNGKETYKKAIEKNGNDKQLYVAIEEKSEQKKQISNNKLAQNNHQKIVEEIADVEIMLQQLKMICDVKCSELEGAKYQKTERLAERLNSEKPESEDQRYIHIDIYDDNFSIKGYKAGPDAIIKASDGLANILIRMK